MSSSPQPIQFLHGYLHFEALTDHEYQYSCVTCGDHPPVVIMDLHKKASFHLSGKKNVLVYGLHKGRPWFIQIFLHFL